MEVNFPPDCWFHFWKEISLLSKHGNCSRPIREMVLHQTQKISNKHFPLLNISLIVVREAGIENEVWIKPYLTQSIGPVSEMRKPKNFKKGRWPWSHPRFGTVEFLGTENSPKIFCVMQEHYPCCLTESGLWLSRKDEIIGCFLFRWAETW